MAMRIDTGSCGFAVRAGRDVSPCWVVATTAGLGCTVIAREDLETMTSRDLHDRAIGTAKAEGDLDWLWHLLRSIPAAEGEVGDLEDSGMDMVSTVSAINGYTRADRDLPGTLRSKYVDYLLEHL